MNFFHLKYFYDSVKYGGVTEAAQKNFVTQSAISQSIRSLEKSLNIELVQHKKNLFELTEAGKLTISHCENIFLSLDNLKEDIQNLNVTPKGTLVIAATNSIALTYLSSVLKIITEKYTEIKITMKLGNSDQVKNFLLSKEADFGIILEDDEMSGFEQINLGKGNFVLIKSPNFRVKETHKNIIVTREAKIEVRELKKQFKKKNKIDIIFKMEVYSWELIRQLCLDGAGIGYLPDYLVYQDIEFKKLVEVITDIPKWKYNISLIYLEGKKLGKNANLFLSELTSNSKF